MKKIFLKVFGNQKSSDKSDMGSHIKEVPSPLKHGGDREKHEHPGLLEQIEREIKKDIGVLEELVEDLIDDFCHDDWTY